MCAIYDLETLKTFFSACFLDVDTQKKREFVICKYRNDWNEFHDFLMSLMSNDYTLVGFNNLHFDSQVIQFILNNAGELNFMTPDEMTEVIYNEAQRIIDIPEENKYQQLVPEWKLTIPQLDLYLINHYDNKNRRTSLKWLEFTMQMELIEDMPIPHKKPVEESDIPNILHYNWHDVEATYLFYLKNLDNIKLRQGLKERYNLNCLNWNNGKIGSNLLLDLYCRKTHQDKKEVRQMKTINSELKGMNIVFPYIKFESEEFNNLLTRYKNLNITSTKGVGDFSLKYKNYIFEYGLGGIHQCIRPGVYKSDDNWIIKDGDVASLYPSIAVQNKLYPSHLGEDFYKLYDKDIVSVRLAEKAKPKEKQDKSLIAAFKEVSNVTYGKSGESFSWLYDTYYMMRTTVNGQLLISMWVEKLLTIPDVILLQCNTDGVTVKFKKEYLNQYNEICRWFSELTGFTLEFADYKQMIILTVNDYLAEKTNGEVKEKGDFVSRDHELHKNNSSRIIPMALREYFINNINYIDYLKQEHHILDFCKGIKKKSNFTYVLHKVTDGDYTPEEYKGKVLRYFVSTNGGNLMKHYNDGRKSDCESGWKSTVLNDLRRKSKNSLCYLIDYRYYTQKIKDIILQIEGDKNQLSLFE